MSRVFLESLEPANQYFADHRLHLHVPEGATPKVTVTITIRLLATPGVEYSVSDSQIFAVGLLDHLMSNLLEG